MCPKSVTQDVAVAAAPAAKKAEKKAAAQVNGMKGDGLCQCIMHILWHYMYLNRVMKFIVDFINKTCEYSPLDFTI